MYMYVYIHVQCRHRTLKAPKSSGVFVLSLKQTGQQTLSYQSLTVNFASKVMLHRLKMPISYIL